MKNYILLYFTCIMFIFTASLSHAQLPTLKVRMGQIILAEPLGAPNSSEQKLKPVLDSLDKNIKNNPGDTTSLLYRAYYYLKFNNILKKPHAVDKAALTNLLKANQLVDSAVAHKMENFNLKVLRAQVLKELAYRYTADESWQMNPVQLAERKKQYETFKFLANKYYDELGSLDASNAYNYQQLKVTGDYPVK